MKPVRSRHSLFKRSPGNLKCNRLPLHNERSLHSIFHSERSISFSSRSGSTQPTSHLFSSGQFNPSFHDVIHRNRLRFSVLDFISFFGSSSMSLSILFEVKSKSSYCWFATTFRSDWMTIQWEIVLTFGMFGGFTRILAISRVVNPFISRSTSINTNGIV